MRTANSTTDGGVFIRTMYSADKIAPTNENVVVTNLENSYF